MKNLRSTLAAVVLGLTAALALVACGGKQTDTSNVPDRPSPKAYLNDMAGIIKEDATDTISARWMEDSLKSYASTSPYIIYVVTTTQDLGNMGAQAYAAAIASKWELGDSSVVLFIQRTPQAFQVGIAPGAAVSDKFPQRTIDQIIKDKIGYVIMSYKGRFDRAAWNGIREIKDRLK